MFFVCVCLCGSRRSLMWWYLMFGSCRFGVWIDLSVFVFIIFWRIGLWIIVLGIRFIILIRLWMEFLIC